MNSLGQGFAGLALVLSFALLCPRQIGLALLLLTAQAASVAVAAAAQADWLAAGGALACGAIAAPMVTRWLLQRHDMPHTTLPVGGRTLALAAGSVLTALALPIGALGLPLAVLLLGVLLVATRRHPAMHLVGLLAIQNGLTLAVIGRTWRLDVAAVLPLVPALYWAALWLRPPRLRSWA